MSSVGRWLGDDGVPYATIRALPPPMRLSIVIPTLDEEEALVETLATALPEADEVVVSDGGSGDRTRELAHDLGAKFVEGRPQRGAQLNRGAHLATGEILLFLHADTRLAPGSGDAVRRAIREGAVGGGFRLRFDHDRATLRRFAWMINQRTRWTRCPLGDQAQFVRTSTFETLKGFREWPLLEDLDFVRRLKRQGPTALLDPPVSTSARRYVERGPWRNVARNWVIFGLYFAGVSPNRLERLYRRRPADFRSHHGTD